MGRSLQAHPLQRAQPHQTQTVWGQDMVVAVPQGQVAGDSAKHVGELVGIAGSLNRQQIGQGPAWRVALQLGSQAIHHNRRRAGEAQ